MKQHNSLLLFNRPTQAQWTRHNDITAIKLAKHLYALPRHLDSNPKVVVDVSFERLDVVRRIRPRFSGR